LLFEVDCKVKMWYLLEMLFSKDKKIKKKKKKEKEKVKLKWLQIRIVHRILATNVVFMKMGIVNCSKCTFFKDDKDSIDHIFGSVVFFFLLQILESELNTKCNITIQARITQNLVFFCLDSDNSVKTDEVFGFIILFANSFSWGTKSKNIMPRSSPETISFIL